MAHLIGTAGHVDHGKTTLIKALTGIDADRLPEEKRRGLTIEVGFAHFELPGVGLVSIVDVPGHERFLHHMLAGAMGVGVALLCVAADSGVMPQTTEHLQILDLLPTSSLVVALTRCDVADADMQEIAKLQIADALTGTRFRDVPVIPVSAVTGDGLDALRQALAVALKSLPAPAARPWYLPIDRLMVHKGHGTVIAGSLVGRSINQGDSVEIQPEGVTGRIRGLQVHGNPQAEATPGHRVALNLSGVDNRQIARGSLAGEPGTVFASDIFDGTMRWIKTIKHGVRVRVSIGADEVIARIFLSDADENLVQLRLERPAGVSKGMPMVLRTYSPASLIGGGVVTTPIARKRRKSEVIDVTKPVEEGVDAMIETVGSAAWGMETDEIARKLGQAQGALASQFESHKASGALLGFAGLWLTPSALEDAMQRLIPVLKKLHAEFPSKALLPREEVMKAAGSPWRGKSLDRIVSHLTSTGFLRSQGTLIALADHVPELSSRQRGLLDQVMEEMQASGLAALGSQELAAKLKVPHQAIVDILRIGLEAGELVVISDGLIYSRLTLAELTKNIREAFQGKTFTPADFRDRFGSTRKYAIPLLEYLDARQVTSRVQDGRVVNQ